MHSNIPKPSPSECSPPFYTGTPDSELGGEITPEEVETALHALRRQKAPDQDRICNTILRHRYDTSTDPLTKLFNVKWNAGPLPRSRKH